MSVVRVLRQLGVILLGIGVLVMSLAFLLRIALLFAVISVGPPAYPTVSLVPMSLRASLDLDWLLFATLAYVPFLVVAYRLVKRRSGLTRAAWFGVAQCSLLVLAFSYRLPGLIAGCGLCIAGAAGVRPSRWFVAVGTVVLCVTCLLPRDISLRLTSGAPHFAQAVSGTLGGGTEALVAKGEIVVVGGCTQYYFAPDLVWVW